MERTTVRLAYGVCLVLGFLSSTSSGNLISNGDFSTVSGNTWQDWDYDDAGTGIPVASGEASFDEKFIADQGHFYPSLRQTLENLTPNQEYVLSFDLFITSFLPAPESDDFSVFFGGVEVMDGDLPWHQPDGFFESDGPFTTRVTALSATQDLLFKIHFDGFADDYPEDGVNQLYYTKITISNVGLTAVPVPAAVMLGILGLSTAVIKLRRDP